MYRYRPVPCKVWVGKSSYPPTNLGQSHVSSLRDLHPKSLLRWSGTVWNGLERSSSRPGEEPCSCWNSCVSSKHATGASFSAEGARADLVWFERWLLTSSHCRENHLVFSFPCLFVSTEELLHWERECQLPLLAVFWIHSTEGSSPTDIPTSMTDMCFTKQPCFY